MGKRLVLHVWLAACAVVLAMTIYASLPAPTPNDIGLFFLGCMIVLTFPSGLLVLGLVALLVKLQAFTGPFLDFVQPAIVGLALVWVGMVVVGYFQWFVFVPWVMKRLWKFGGRGDRQAPTES